VTWTNYLISAGGLVGMHVENVGGTILTRYFTKENRGSVAVITDETGTVLEVLGGLAAVAGGGKFANGAITGAFGYLFNFFGENEHEYAYRAPICATSEPGCYAGAVFDGLLRSAYPGQPDGTIVQDGDPGTVWGIEGGNPIRTIVEPERMSITNITEWEHSFCCGYVTRTVVEDNGWIYIDTYGWGANRNMWWAGWNWVAGYGGFLPSTLYIQSYVRHSVPGPAFP
jgi:hypothetical protein